MSWRSYLGGRYSPFASGAPPPAPPRVTEDDYHYLGPDDIVDPPSTRPYSHHGRHPGEQEDDASHPDVLILKHRGSTYPLHFPAYSIGEGILRVGELRRYAAEKTGTSDPRRIKLLYKGHVLKDDAVACCEEGLKQNSELMCVVSEAPSGGSRRRADDVDGARLDSDDSASDEDVMRGSRQNRRAESSAGITGPRVNVDGTIIDDGPPRRRRHGAGAAQASAIPERTSPQQQQQQPTRRTENNATRAEGHLHPTPTTAAAGASATATPAVPTPSASPKPQTVPRTPREKLDAIADTLRGKWTPLVQQYAAKPPRDAKARDQEYRKLSESILQQVLLKLDDIITEGDTDLRTARKAMIVETQNVLADLDAAKSRHD